MQQLSHRGFQRSFLNGRRVANTISGSYGTAGTSNNGISSVMSHLQAEPAKRFVTKVTKVSTTRGSPSTSVDLKDAVREKIPLHYDLLRKFRSRHGSKVISQITVNDLYDGLRNVNTLARETSEMDPRNGLCYRNLTLPEVLALLPRRGNAPSPEAVFWLLLTGDVPTYEQTASLVADWTLRRQRRKSWWHEAEEGYFVGGIFRALPKNVSPLGKLSIALAALDATDGNMKKVGGRGTMSYTYWEHTYEEGMELLANLPAIVALSRGVEKIQRNQRDEGDWVDFFLDCSGLLFDTIEERKRTSFADFLRLYITANADEDGGTPSTHVTHILGAFRMELSKTLASGALVHSNVPATGTMLQCAEFQENIRSHLGREPTEEALKGLLIPFFEKDHETIGHKEGDCDSRYAAFSDFAREHMSEDPEVKLSREISRILSSMANSSERNLSPEQTFITAPMFRFYGLKNMEFNQTLLWMSRALGVVASTILTRAIDVPVEHPTSKCTYTYVNSFGDVRRA